MTDSDTGTETGTGTGIDSDARTDKGRADRPGPRAGARGRSGAKREAILRAALTVFLREGYAGASVDVIAATAGVGKQTVYAHFGDKEKLFLAAAREAQAVLDDADGHELWKSPMPRTGDVRRDLVDAAVRVLRAVLAPESAALHRMTVAEITRHPELQHLWRDNASREVMADVVDYLVEKDARGELSVPEPETTARQFVLLVATEGRVRSLHGTVPLTEADLVRIGEETADLIVRAHRAEAD
ncbi:TetR/AcrR family transcriptional regulator C-terminal domain-containing protein [Streptomyces sp. NPDC008150]|uniref:TetR/AcrR family transcriptional regulator n=1 Tax=Streptomyces sp. NPDC008150 TaxID=3364816 RepID=UPI0036E312DD